MPRCFVGPLEIEYNVVGPAGGDVVVLSTGFGDQLTMWPLSLQGALSAAGLRVVSFDTRDAGLSSDSQGYSLDDLADDLLSIAAEVGTAAACVNILGYSMGGQIAMRAALRAPERVESLALLFSTSGAPELSSPSPAAIAASLSVCERSSRQDAINRRIELMRVTNGPSFRFSDDSASMIAAADYDRAYRPEGVARHLSAMVHSYPIHDRIESLRCRSLIFQASHDCFFGQDHGDDLAKRLSGEFRLIDGAGHNLTEELGALLAHSLVPFFTKHQMDE